MLKQLNTKIFRLPSGMLVDRTKSDHCGDIIIKIRRGWSLSLIPRIENVSKSHMTSFTKWWDIFLFFKFNSHGTVYLFWGQKLEFDARLTPPSDTCLLDNTIRVWLQFCSVPKKSYGDHVISILLISPTGVTDQARSFRQILPIFCQISAKNC